MIKSRKFHIHTQKSKKEIVLQNLVTEINQGEIAGFLGPSAPEKHDSKFFIKCFHYSAEEFR